MGSCLRPRGSEEPRADLAESTPLPPAPGYIDLLRMSTNVGARHTVAHIFTRSSSARDAEHVVGNLAPTDVRHVPSPWTRVDSTMATGGYPR